MQLEVNASIWLWSIGVVRLRTRLPARPVLRGHYPHEWELNEHDVLAQPSPSSVSPFNG